jgi:CHASE2 domain-containing sensor protein
VGETAPTGGWAQALGTPLAVALLAALCTFATIKFVEPNHHAPYDAITRSVDRSAEQNTSFTIVDVGVKTRSRVAMAATIDALTQARPRVIALDILLDEAGLEPTGDAELASAIRLATEAGVPIVVAAELTPGGPDGPGQLLRPIAPILSAGAELAVANIGGDGRGAFREAFAHVMDGDERVLGFSAAIARHLTRDLRFASGGDALLLATTNGSARRPLRRGLPSAGREGSRFPIDFAGGTDAVRKVPEDALATALELAASPRPQEQLASRLVLEGLVKDRAVILGNAGLVRNGDVHYAPALRGDGPVPGVIIQAHALRTLLDGPVPIGPHGGWHLLWAFTASLGAALTLGRIRSVRVGGALVAIAVVAVLIAACVLFVKVRVMLPVYALAGGMVLAFGLDLWRRLRAERRAIMSYFSQAALSGVESESELKARGPDAADDALTFLPYPIASVRSSVRSYPIGRERVQRLIDLAEATIKTLTAIAVCDALRLGLSDRLRKTVEEALPHPSLGRFTQLLREACGLLKDHPLDATVPELAIHYTTSRSTRNSIDRLVEVRNRLRGHGAVLPARECEALAPTLEADLEQLLGKLQFLEGYPLCSALSTKRAQDGSRLASVHLLVGPAETHAHADLKVAQDPPTGCVIVVSQRTGALLNLSPLLEILPCRKHAVDEVAFLNGLTQRGSPHYLSYTYGCSRDRFKTPQGARERLASFVGPVANAALLIGALLP